MKSTISNTAASIVNYAVDPHIDKQVKEFLKVLNSGGAPLETLSKEDARNVLVSDQASVQVDLSGVEGEAYGRKLNEAGVSVTTVRYNGMIHDFGLLNALATVPSVKSLIVQAGAELKKYLFN